LKPGEVSHWVREYIAGCDHPDFQAYAAGRAESADQRFEWLMQHLARLGRMHDGRILDIGSGFGWDAVALSILTGGTVVANDIRPLMTSLTAQRVAAIRKQGAPVSVEVLTGDICTLDLPDASFDAIVCNQTIEHVHDLEAMLRVSYRVLKPGGRMVITNDNNVRNRRQFAEIQELWKKRDSDWGFIEQLKRERPEENREIQPYAVMREAIVRRANPRLADSNARTLVGATAGLTEAEIARIALGFTPAGPLPTPPALSWCRNPVTGEYCERQLDPAAVVEMLRSCGFRARFRHGFRRWPLSALNGVRFPPLNAWLFQLRPFFIIVGLRPTGVLSRGGVEQTFLSSETNSQAAAPGHGVANHRVTPDRSVSPDEDRRPK
jgi:ubiquinone/menaquinone biosynthesis C-methylase UbiE